jgi:ABC-type bacteriocin/lantibiotic exporter with double-glycine peptidase domain
MLIIGGYLLVHQQLNIGQFIAAEIVILMVLGSVEKLIVNLDKVYDVLTSIEKITKVIDKPNEKSGDVLLSDLDSPLHLKVIDLSFHYEEGKNVLQNVTFEILAGEKICIMGKDNSGKSTLLRLLTGTYPNYNGSILINGVPLSNYDTKSIRVNTGILVQMQDIFQGTLRENICVGDESITTFQLNELAEIVGLKKFVDDHKEGYDLELFPMGQHLSGRVIKMILLMRALIHKPKLLLLEEPWLGLEEEYANKIKEYLLSYSKNNVMVVVGNDEEFAAKCNKVIVLEKGTIKSLTVK